MDIVITYVDGNDPVWRESYSEHTHVPIMTKRFRDWGTLPYLFRGIERNLPFVENVFLVVAGESQVPDWVCRDTVKVVCHSDFVPEEFLPTFNSNPLEMYLHRIKGLGERFLYFNDDMFPLLPCSETDFFRGDKGVLRFSPMFIVGGNMFRRICRNSDALARKAAGLPPSGRFLRPQHICSPMQRSLCEELFRKTEDEIRASISRTRNAGNLTQYLYLDYMFYKGRMIDEKISNKHISVAFARARSVSGFILNPSRKMVCINDVHLGGKHYEAMREAILGAFAARFPEKSRYEK